MGNENNEVEAMELSEESERNKRQYRIIRLPNEMKVMLVHDDRVNEDEKHRFWPSCALTISVGSLSDPSDFPGLAKIVGIGSV